MPNNFQKELVLALHAQLHTANAAAKFTKNDLMHLVPEATKHICQAIEQNPNLARKYSSAANTVAFITDGSGLKNFKNNAFPFAEHQTLLLKTISTINAIPLYAKCNEFTSLEQIITSLIPNFGAINLVEINESKAVQIENTLTIQGKIPVIWAAKESTCILALSSLKRAAILLKKNLCEVKTIIFGSSMLAGIVSQFLKKNGWTDLHIIPCNKNPSAKPDHQELEFISGAEVLLNFTSQEIISDKKYYQLQQEVVVLEFANFASFLTKESDKFLYASSLSFQKNALDPFLITPAILQIALQTRKSISDETRCKLANKLVNYTTRWYPRQLLPPLWDQNITASLLQNTNDHA